MAMAMAMAMASDMAEESFILAMRAKMRFSVPGSAAVGSRVLFEHSGDLKGFFVNSKWVRFLVFLGVLDATTRATPAWVPSTTVSHHIYASWTWGILALLWLLWHRKRFVKRDEEE